MEPCCINITAQRARGEKRKLIERKNKWLLLTMTMTKWAYSGSTITTC